MFSVSDVRIDAARSANAHWEARGKMTHLPTGITVEFVEKWNDKSDCYRAMAELEQLVEQNK